MCSSDLEYSTWKLDTIEPGGKVEHRRIIRPMYQRFVSYTGAAGVNGYECARGFLSAASGDIAHYGLLGNIAGSSGGSNMLCVVEYYYECKNQK